MPRSVFLGRVVKRGEPTWLDEDRNYLLALQSYEDNTCDGCGQQLHESTDPSKHAKRYHLDDPEICNGCAAVKRDLTDWQEHSMFRAMKFRLLSDREEPRG